LEKNLHGLSSEEAQLKKYHYDFALDHFTEGGTERDLEVKADKQRSRFPRRSGAVLLR
jgi:hypothetical protein